MGVDEAISFTAEKTGGVNACILGKAFDSILPDEKGEEARCAEARLTRPSNLGYQSVWKHNGMVSLDSGYICH